MHNHTAEAPQPRHMNNHQVKPKSQKPNAVSVRPSQRWKKKDSGQIMTVICRQGEAWRVAFDTRTKKSSHKILDRVIKRFYELL